MEQQTTRRALPGRCIAAGLVLVLLAMPAAADELVIEVDGIEDPLLANVRGRVDSFAVRGDTRLSSRRLRQIVENVEREAALAMRPFGYYRAEVSSELIATGESRWLLAVQVDRGPPMTIAASTVEVRGAGADLPELQAWRDDWPLGIGKRLDHRVWEAQKRNAVDITEAHGYLNAAFVEHRIAADLERNEATTTLVLETGQRAVMGSIRFEQDAVKPGILENLPRFDDGQPYDAWLLEKFRSDLWRAGYFDEIEIVEERRLEETPPRVNLVVSARIRKRNTYQGTIGFGTDTGVRAQVLWSRHLLSSRGDSLEMGLGWQQKNNEFSFRSGYKLPRRTRDREFWTADLFLRRENQDLRIRPDEDEADFITLANGDATDYSVKAGRLIVRDLARGYQQLFENWYAQFVLEDNAFRPIEPTEPGAQPPISEQAIEQFDQVDSSVAVGINWDWPVVRGSAFQTVGHHERAWIFTASEAWGSGKEFSQAYVSSNWHRMIGSRFKLLLRGEVGYSDADVEKRQLEVEGQPLELSVTRLPNLYRFKAGGSRSVRGYAFESLNNNGLGSNNMITASAEMEMNFREDWSVAAFFDIGNAFNSWSDVELRRGAGVGLRWYSIVGAIRLDVAQALDFTGEPWRIHFTIGTPLL
jgi:translocation and assembly module TamA